MITEEEIKMYYVSNKEAAQILDVNESRIRQLLNSDKLPGSFKFADVWLIPRESVECYERRKPGKKPSQGNKNSEIEELKRQNEELRRQLQEAVKNGGIKEEETEEKKRAKLMSLIHSGF